MLVGYVWLIGRMPEVQRVFEYHGAEHRAIHAYEHGPTLTPASVLDYPNAHPRCGTAFLLTVMLISLVVFLLLGSPAIWVRLVERIVLIPVIASLAYEVLRLGQRYGDNPIVARLYAPNLWLQKLTTRDPDEQQVEVAIAAVQAALAVEAGAPRPARHLPAPPKNPSCSRRSSVARAPSDLRPPVAYPYLLLYLLPPVTGASTTICAFTSTVRSPQRTMIVPVGRTGRPSANDAAARSRIGGQRTANSTRTGVFVASRIVAARRPVAFDALQPGRRFDAHRRRRAADQRDRRPHRRRGLSPYRGRATAG